MPTYEPQGERLKALRNSKKRTLDGLAQAVGTSRQHLIRLEQGLHKPKPEMAAALSAELGEDIASFYEIEVGDDDETEDMAAALQALAALRRFFVADLSRDGRTA